VKKYSHFLLYLLKTWLAKDGFFLYIALIFSLPCPGKCEIVKLLLSRGADVHGKSEEGTPLHFAAIKGYESTVEVLLEHHADVMCL
jgi:ankyrin repeat protein